MCKHSETTRVYQFWSLTRPVGPARPPRGHPGWPRFLCSHLGAAQEGTPRPVSGPSSLALDLQSPFFEATGFWAPSAYVITRPKKEAAPVAGVFGFAKKKKKPCIVIEKLTTIGQKKKKDSRQSILQCASHAHTTPIRTKKRGWW